MTACDVYDWIFEVLRLSEDEVRMIQIDGTKRQVFIKLAEKQSVVNRLHPTAGQEECKHHTVEITQVAISEAGMGFKRIRVANLPPEVKEEVLKAALAPYWTVMDIREEKWSRVYRYVVANDIRQVTMTLTNHIPPHLTVEGHRVLIAYDGQPMTCYGCGETGHLYPTCPSRRTIGPETRVRQRNTYTSIAAPMKINTNNMTPGSPLVKQVTQSPTADLSDATDGDITAPRVEIGTHKNTQRTIETHAQTSLETQPEPELISDQPRQTSDSTHLNIK
jgi:hypothetical protein